MSDRFYKNIFESKISTNDAGFDSRFHIASTDEDFVGEYFAEVVNRESAEAIFQQNCAMLELEFGTLRAVWKLDDGLSAERLKNSLPHLAILAKNAQTMAVLPQPQMENQRRFNLGIILVMALGLLVSLISLIFCNYILDENDVFWESLHYSGPALVILWIALAGGYMGMGKRKNKLLFPITMIGTLSLALFPLAGYALETFFNCRLDSSSAVEHRVPIVRVLAGRADAIVLRSWRFGHYTERIPLQAFPDMEHGQTMATVTTKSGYFGHEWVLGYRLDDPRRPL